MSTIDSLLPDPISDETAVALCELLYTLADAFENHYFAQLRRYYQAFDDLQPDLFDPDEPGSTTPDID